MRNKDEALRLAREALLKSVAVGGFDSHPALAAIEEALAQPEQEPFGYVRGKTNFAIGWSPINKNKLADDDIALYTAPPLRERSEMRDLTDEEIDKMADEFEDQQGRIKVNKVLDFARAIIIAMRGKA